MEEKEGFRCLCLPGYGGDLCDVGECVEGHEGRTKSSTLPQVLRWREVTGLGLAMNELPVQTSYIFGLV